MLDTSYIKDLSDKELLEFINDMQDSVQGVKDQFNFDEHVRELISRSTRGKMVTRTDIFRALNNVDKSFDYSEEKTYVLDVTEFLEELGL